MKMKDEVDEVAGKALGPVRLCTLAEGYGWPER